MREDKTHILVVDDDLESRGRLKQVFLYLQRKDTAVTYTNSIKEADSRLKEPVPLQAILVSSAFGKDALSEFVTYCKSTPGGAQAVPVLILKGSHQDKNFVARNLLQGFSGFVCEPYSCEMLSEVMEEWVKNATPFNDEKKKDKTTEFLLQDLVAHVDRMSLAAAVGTVAGQSKKSAKEAVTIIEHLNKGQEEALVEALTAQFENAPARPALQKRLKKKKEVVKTEAPKKQEYRVIKG